MGDWDTTFSRFCDGVKAECESLLNPDGAALFAHVALGLSRPSLASFPACWLFPIEDPEDLANNAQQDVKYRVGVLMFWKESELAAKALYARSAVRARFRQPNRFLNMPSGLNVVDLEARMGPILTGEFKEYGRLAASGIEITLTVREDR